MIPPTNHDFQWGRSEVVMYRQAALEFHHQLVQGLS